MHFRSGQLMQFYSGIDTTVVNRREKGLSCLDYAVLSGRAMPAETFSNSIGYEQSSNFIKCPPGRRGSRLTNL